jgi:hypothetical protein
MDRMKKTLKHVRQHAMRHHEAHQRLKGLLSRHNPKPEMIGGAFLITFILALLGILAYRHWDTLVDLVRIQPTPPPQAIETQGAETGVGAVYQVQTQANVEYKKSIDQIDTKGGFASAMANEALGEGKNENPQAAQEALQNVVGLTNSLGQGQNLTPLDQSSTRILLKSVLSTYYLGEKTVDINSTLDMDTKLLSSIKNALSVDLFEYLNQSNSRADTLESYLNLLKNLKARSDQRITDLQYKIDFLNANYKGQQTVANQSEQAFFDNLKIFDGPNAEDELAKFIGLQGSQTEIKAKSGAYDSLKRYYQFFSPKLDNLIRSIDANRDALIAGVKVVEIQNMTLPLIIQQK